MRHRWYDPIQGRFLSKDPIRSSVNFYQYATNRPLSYIDPLGLRDLQIDGWKIRLRFGDKDFLPGIPHGHIMEAPKRKFVGKKVNLITGEILEVAGQGRAGYVLGRLPRKMVDKLRRTPRADGGLLGQLIGRLVNGEFKYIEALSKYGGNLLMVSAITLTLSRIASADPCDRRIVAEDEVADWVVGELVAAGFGATLRSSVGRATVGTVVRSVISHPATAASIVAAAAGWTAGRGFGHLPVGYGQTVDSNLQWIFQNYVFDHGQDILVPR
jgi:hypothetical protein